MRALKIITRIIVSPLQLLTILIFVNINAFHKWILFLIYGGEAIYYTKIYNKNTISDKIDEMIEYFEKTIKK